MAPDVRERLDALARSRGQTTGALLRTLGLAEVDRVERVEAARAELRKRDPEEWARTELGRPPRRVKRSRTPPGA